MKINHKNEEKPAIPWLVVGLAGLAQAAILGVFVLLT